MMHLIDEQINNAISYGLFFDDWLSMKKYLLRSLPTDIRSHFSTRDPKTKKQNINEFEVEIIKRYEKMTGKEMGVPPHEPTK